ncbi:MAG: hypothetical protein R3A80_04285 [Bdellovibrionota bacterium]
MKKFVLAMCLFLVPLKPARADMWGGDIPLLIEIVFNTLQQLLTMKDMLENQEDQLDLLREINAGINDSLQMIHTTFPNVDAGIYKDWSNIGSAIKELQKVYGEITPSKNEEIEKNTDQSVAEAVVLNNDIYKYTKEVDQIGELIKKYSHEVSPGGAAKLTAQSLGVMLTVMNQSLRAQATSLKIQAQTLALQNKEQKEFSKTTIESASGLAQQMRELKVDFTLPRWGRR